MREAGVPLAATASAKTKSPRLSDHALRARVFGCHIGSRLAENGRVAARKRFLEVSVLNDFVNDFE